MMELENASVAKTSIKSLEKGDTPTQHQDRAVDQGVQRPRREAAQGQRDVCTSEKVEHDEQGKGKVSRVTNQRQD